MKRAAFLLAGLLAFLPVLAAPDAMTDLAASAPTKAPQLHVTLTFTAPSGATSYDIRYSTSLITSANFSSASVAGTRTLTGSTITPGSVGTVQSTEILGLTPNTLYYFAMKSSDGVTPSAMSNVVTITTAKYQGYGYAVPGGGDGTICRVTNLADSGTGSLRGCISTSRTCTSTPLTIIFNGVAGDIPMSSNINLTANNCKMTIDGSTATSPGITITKGTPCATSPTCPAAASTCMGREFTIGASSGGVTQNIILTYLRFTGNYQQGWGYCEGGGYATLGPQYNFSNLVFDHLTVRNGGDGAPDIWSGTSAVTNVSMSNMLIAWSSHPQLIGSQSGSCGGCSTRSRSQISLYRNVYARFGQRGPLIRGNVLDLEFRNNIVFDWSSSWWGGGGGDGTEIAPQLSSYESQGKPTVNIINNWWKTGGNNTGYALFYGTRAGADSADCCTAPGSCTGSGADEGLMCDGGGACGAACPAQGTVCSSTNMGDMRVYGNTLPSSNCDQWSTRADERPYADANAALTTISAASLAASVLPDVGTHYRTSDEIALLNEISPTAAAVCGNGVKEGSEVCDGTDFGTDSCVLHGFVGGTLTCDVTCSLVTTGNCTITAVRRSVMKGVTIKGGYIP